jgi:hypothetical protein
MSLATYIGCNVEIPVNDEYYNEYLVYFGRCFADDNNLQNVMKYQFTTHYVYEVSSDWGINISEHAGSKTFAESKKKLIGLCKIMDKFLPKGGYFELYSCWVGEENEKREGKILLKINDFDVDQIEIPEKTLVRFEK